LLLATTGWTAWTGTEDNWLGGPAPMWWSQADALFWARKPAAAPPQLWLNGS
jgi:hypothetical protein